MEGVVDGTKCVTCISNPSVNFAVYKQVIRAPVTKKKATAGM